MDTPAPDGLLPLFPLGTVLFPDGRLPLRIFEARYTDMTRDCLRHARPFGVCMILEGREVGAPASHVMYGTLAHITECDMAQLGLINLVTRGGQRFRVLRTEVNRQGLVLGEVELVPPEPELPLPAQYAACARILQAVIREHGDDLFHAPHRLEDAAWVGQRLAELLPLPLAIRQSLLELRDPLARLAQLRGYLEQGGVKLD